MSEEIRLNDSQLGSQEYRRQPLSAAPPGASHTDASSWNQFYRKEIENFGQNEQDTGECWFDDSGAERKVVDFFCLLVDEHEVPPTARLVDLGTGNGHLLFELFETICDECPDAGLQYHGIDYSPDSVAFAQLIAQRRYPQQRFTFETVDFISQDCAYLAENAGSFDVLFDKGTLDAIALNNDPVPGFGGKIGSQVYPIQVEKLMHAGSLLILTSCNFTEAELIQLITQNGTNALRVWRKISYPSFKFGGVAGSTICSIAFVKDK
ncbi:hypothetical protein METBIDRAFT_11909 [Metschnikowia bicuspidata var. bicuspidata NRRL YB-4993]|uniref:Protein-lysine N-methyltransferase EFM4 n=1 Tax=Metschnikowia bicuspidata var. bicuspidata NRRL YB-4993 TaxID=869754 RepID=A0A1A0HBJ8_9ASCO|nr:hypothetical protein METBIDRAFT_11909 [Metschnikowia bicuspidata var. bicuspidata NRRL YB-4993]OBA21386.1 hypothetical protein METBIDRAFT_11909 [Metschnikowia bicuspidata var. bicuspidata NRRL YB-4993]